MTRFALLLPLLLLPFGPGLLSTARGDDDEEEDPVPREVPVRVEAQVDAEGLAQLGRWRLRLAFVVEEDVTRPYRVELRVTHRSETVVDLDHAPEPPTPSWRRGQRVEYEIPIPVPTEAGIPAGTRLDLLLGFWDPDAERIVPPRTDEGLWGNRLPLARLDMPELGPIDDEEGIARIVDAAKEKAKAGEKATAWRILEMGIRRAAEDATKARYRDALLEIAPFEPEPLSVLEQQIVDKRIADERRRYLREVAGRHWDRGRLFAALRLLEEIGGTLAEETNQAVIGALAEARRTEKDMQQIRLKILAQGSEEDKAAAAEAIQKLGPTPKLMKQADAWVADERYARARPCYRELSLAGDLDLSGEAHEKLLAVEAAWVAKTPPDEAELVEQAKNHPAFERLATVVTQKFVYIGPRILVENIPAQARLRFDVAYVFLTDLFGRLPNPSGDRVTVYFKELWDFGGGQGGGKIIDIGRADPEQRGYRVDTGLLYHELTHCVDDTNPILAGWREGLANFGAAYVFEALDQKGDELHAFRSNLEAFEQDYVKRDLAYWRIPNYGPSAGFFLHFVEKYASRAGGHDWRPYRQFFREYRAAPVRDGREPCVVRAFAHYLMRAFGDPVFDDLLAFRLPLVDSDRAAVRAEIAGFEKGENELARRVDEFRTFENSPLPRDLLYRRLIARAGQGASSSELRSVGGDLGILYDWMVIGPFKSPGADPRAVVFPPEREIDYAKEYVSELNTCKWRKAEREGVVQLDDLGWVSFNFSYNDNTATYALTNVVVDADTPAHVHVRADDDFTLFVNDRRIEGYVDRGDNASHRLWWRGPMARTPDALRLPVTLQAGRNKLLLKVKNRFGATGFVLAVSHPNGAPISGLRTDLAAPPVSTRPAPPKTLWKNLARQAFRTRSLGKLEVTVGKFQVKKDRLVGTATDKGVGWRKYTVRPGFPQDSPSNLFWFRDKTTEDLDDFQLRLDLEPPRGKAPKVGVTFQGEGGTDGLSGWNLILHPGGDGKVQARLERYDDLEYQTTDLELPPADDEGILPLLLTHREGRLHVTLGDLVLFEDVAIRPIPGRHRIGVATWGPELGIAAIELEAPKR